MNKALTWVRVVFLVMLLPGPAFATWPERTITIVSPFSAGGTADNLARIMAAGLEKRLNGTVIVENRNGAAGAIGAAYVARARPDGYTLLMASVSTHAILPALKKSLPYNVTNDFAPIILVAEVPNLLIVNAALPVKTVPELIEYAKAASKPLTFASAGVGTSQHLSGELFMKRTGITMVHVPYKGASDVVAAVASGQTDLSFNNFPASIAIARDGKDLVRAVAVTTLGRSPSAPDIPAVSETIPGFETVSWFGLFAPKGVDGAILAQLADASKAILADPAIEPRFRDEGAVVKPLARDTFGTFVADELLKWKQLADGAGIALD